MAQLVEHPTLGFSSGHNLLVVGSSLASGSTLSSRNLLGIHSHSLSLSVSLSLSPPPHPSPLLLPLPLSLLYLSSSPSPSVDPSLSLCPSPARVLSQNKLKKN